MILPAKSLLERDCNPQLREAYLGEGAAPHVADFLARRLQQFVAWDRIAAPRLSAIPDPGAIPTMDRAVERIVRAIAHRERIALACDHDMDGTGSAAVLWSALAGCFGHPAEQLCVVTSHRLTEGYGISEPVVDRILDFGATLVISADKGSSDEPRIARLAAQGIDVVVTDHHVIPESGPPASAYAVVNPSRADCDYDRHVCGAGVAFLVMAKVRSALLESGLRPQLPSLTPLLDYVAVATIADCVSLSPEASLINRTFIRAGMKLVAAQARPCWKAFAQGHSGEIDTEAIAFRLVPAIAAAGRLDWAEAGFRFLIATTDAEASAHWEHLRGENAERQAIERKLRQRAFPQAAECLDPAVVLFFEDGHSGVHGITASRVVEAFGRPCAIFAPKGLGARAAAPEAAPELASGSFRSIPELDVRGALQHVATHHPDLLVAFGGHHSAAGATIRIADVTRFRAAFCNAVTAQFEDGFHPQPTLWTDGDLDASAHSLASIRTLEAIGPFGRGFEAPLYSGAFQVASYRALSEGQHGRLRLRQGQLDLTAIWFNIDAALEPAPSPGDHLQLAYRLARNQFNGEETLQAVVVAGSYR